MRQTLTGQRALDDGLVGAPVKQVVKGHAKEQNRPRYHRGQCVRRIDGIELFCRHFGDKVPNAIEKVAVTQNADCKDRYKKAADQQTDTIYSIRHSNGFQAAENRVDRANDADTGTQNRNRLKLSDAKQFVDIEDTVKCQCA